MSRARSRISAAAEPTAAPPRVPIPPSIAPSQQKAARKVAGLPPIATSRPISRRLLAAMSERSATRASAATTTISETATNMTLFSRRSAKKSGRLSSCQVETRAPSGTTVDELARRLASAASRLVSPTSSRRGPIGPEQELGAIDRQRRPRPLLGLAGVEQARDAQVHGPRLRPERRQGRARRGDRDDRPRSDARAARPPGRRGRGPAGSPEAPGNCAGTSPFEAGHLDRHGPAGDRRSSPCPESACLHRRHLGSLADASRPSLATTASPAAPGAEPPTPASAPGSRRSAPPAFR